MRSPVPIPFWVGLAGGALLLCLACAAGGDEAALPSADAVWIEGYGAVPSGETGAAGGERTYRRIREANGLLTVEYGFVNFDNEPLRIAYTIPSKTLAAYRREYGYTQDDLEAIAQWQSTALAEALQRATQTGMTQGELDTRAEQIQAEARQRQKALFAARGFRLKNGTILIPDLPAIVRRNIGPLYPVARQFSAAAGGGEVAADRVIGPVLAMVQTALSYENLPAVREGRITGGMIPPLLALAEGVGDCDSKSALLAAILLNWDQIKLIGVAVPNHYLLGILRNPAKGEAFVEYGGVPYVLLEPAGPGWLPPGTVAASTLDLLGEEQLRLEAL